MASRLPRLIPLALALSVMGQSLPAQEDGGSGRIISGETLRRAGATRLSDVLRLAGSWDVTSVDGFTWHASPLGGSPFLPARWIVLVDGRRMDLDLFGSSNLDRLGIPLQQVSQVELSDFPRLVAGRITAEGIVRIQTVSPHPGPAGGASFTTGSEIGDPGPFAFTPKATPNVDRSGHDAWVDLTYGGGSWDASATLGSRLEVPTDPAIVQRYVTALGRDPRLDLTAGSARVAARAGGGRHEFAIRHSNMGDALGLRPFGTEIAARERFTQAGLAGTIPAGRGRELVYDLSHGVNRARSTREATGPLLDWDSRTTDGRIELAQRDSPLRFAGVRLRRLAVRSPQDLREPTIALATVYAELTKSGARRSGPTVSAAITFGEGEVGLAALLARGWEVTPTQGLEAVLGYERIVRAEDNSIWAWTERGYELLADAGVSFDVAGSPRAPERLGADLRWSSRPARGVNLSARGMLRRSRNLSLDRRRLHFDVETGSFDATAAIVHGAGGEQAGGEAGVALTVLRGLNIRLAYWYRVVLGGDTLFREAWAAVPNHGARATAEYVPVRSLELWMAASYRGASRWAELEGVDTESGGRYSARLTNVLALDLAIQKWLWDERLRVHFGVRNVLGSDLRHHPTGATFAPMAILQVAGRLP
jgi:hypothetical protein